MTEEEMVLSDLYWLERREISNHQGGRKDYILALQLAIDKVKDQYGIGMNEEND